MAPVEDFTDLVRREREALAAAEQYDFGFVFKQGQRVCFLQRRRLLRQHTFYNCLRCDYNATCVNRTGDSYRAGRVGVNGRSALIEIRVNFHQHYSTVNMQRRTMRVILLGAPGAGKGTQAAFITDQFNIPQISTGDMLRAAVRVGSKLGLAAKQVMDAGELMPDALIVNLVKDRISRDDCRHGYLFDGFPRTIGQAEAMQRENIAIDCVVEIMVADEEIIHRLSGRRVHPGSGRVYHVQFNPPQRPGVDDVSGEALIQRADDQEATVRKRLQVYHEQTAPLIRFYRDQSGANAPSYLRVDGAGDVREVTANLLEGFGKMLGW